MTGEEGGDVGSEPDRDRSDPDGSGRDGDRFDRDVVVVGGGPAGCSAAVFAARYGFDAVVFDRGNSALRRCAYLENYLGFPGGIDVDVFHDLMHAHVEDVGSDRIPEMVVSVDRPDRGPGRGSDPGPDREPGRGTDEGSDRSPDGRSDPGSGHDTGFVVETDEGRRLTTRYVVAAAWYDGSYLRPLDDDGEMFEEHEHHGEVEERFDPDYPDADGRTPVDGLYVAGPAGDRSAQAVVAAGHGAHVVRCLIEDRRRELGYAGHVAARYDWLRSDAEFSGEWGERDRWREWFDNEMGDHDIDDERLAELRETYVDRAFETRVTDEEVEDRSREGIARLVEVVGPDRVLDAVDDDRIRDYLDEPARTDDRGVEAGQ